MQEEVQGQNIFMKRNDPVQTLKGVGPKKAEALQRAGIETVEDLLEFFPREYEDRRRTVPIASLQENQPALIEGKLLSRRFRGYTYKKKSPLVLLVGDSTGSIQIVFFQGSYLSNLFNAGSCYSFYGKVTENNGHLQMIHPEFHRLGDPEDVRGVIPVYPNVEGISQKEMRKLQAQVQNLTDDMEEWLPSSVVRKYRLASPSFAYRSIHRPTEGKQVLQARYRLLFEEFLVLESGLLYMKTAERKNGAVIAADSADEFLAQLSFSLTKGQKAAWEQIADDLQSEKAMNRLIQGDVGSGKTVVSELAIFCTVRSGFQAVMMAPTEILAKQHFHSIRNDMESLGINVGLLVGSMKTAERKELLHALSEGEIDLLIGTHALIQPDVTFRSLGLVVTDEQHRFGVEQRKVLEEKGKAPNIMVMTATPIPRTLAVVLYGDLDISSIHDMPEGRKPVKTFRFTGSSRKKAYTAVLECVKRGEQAYVVSPLISESDKIDARSAEELYEELTDFFEGYPVALLHGSMTGEEKDRIMNSFATGEISVLVSTVVIEIGINVPNATCMVMENCERFGLAQMHQLRGRVGRGGKQSFCFLILGKSSEMAEERVRALCDSADGFLIAEKDMKLRGPGELFGTRQHGLPEKWIADIFQHQDVLEKAKEAAGDILRQDTEFAKKENRELRRRIEKLFGEGIRLEL